MMVYESKMFWDAIYCNTVISANMGLEIVKMSLDLHWLRIGYLMKHLFCWRAGRNDFLLLSYLNFRRDFSMGGAVFRSHFKFSHNGAKGDFRNI